ncbi:MAG: hypothetical protein WBB00_25170 [Mycobacterium sp.]
MRTTPLTEVDRQRQRIRLVARQIETALAHRPGSVPPWSPWSPLQVCDRLGAGPVLLADAGQLDAIEAFARLWLALLPESEGAYWSDPDDTPPPAVER